MTVSRLKGNKGKFWDQVTVPFSARGVFAGGVGASQSNVIDYVTITTTGNATDFGDLIDTDDYVVGCSSSTRGLFAAAGDINYITI